MQMTYWTTLTCLQDAIVADNQQVTVLTLLFQGSLSTLKFLDMFTDAGVAALWYREYRAAKCIWHGEQRCDIFLRQFAILTATSCLAYLVVLLMKVLPVFSQSPHSRPVLIALHTAVLFCEVCTLVVIGMQLAAVEHTSALTPLSPPSVLFVLLSGCLTVAVFLLSVYSLYRSWAAEAAGTVSAAPVNLSLGSVHPEDDDS